SRRRHTRWPRDWSSDVCSSDLGVGPPRPAVVPADQLMPAALERAHRLAGGPRRTYALIKRGLVRALDLDLEQVMELEAQLQTLAARTPDAQEAIRAFIEKRKPVFRA